MAPTQITDLVLVPGLLCTEDLYADQLSALADIARMTVARHAGHSTVAAIAAAVLETAPPKFALAGLSMGGYVAFEIVRQAPDRVDRLALLDTGPRPDTPERSEGRRKLIELGRTYGLAAVQKQLLPNLIHKDRLTDAPLVERVVKMAEDTGFEGFVNQQEALMSRPDCRPLLGTIRCPTLIVVGNEDILTPPDLAREMHAGIAGSRLVNIPACGHLSTMERPDTVNRALSAWLAGDGA